MEVLILSAISVYGLCRIITCYDGPFGVFAKLRKMFPNSPLTCTVCLSVWASVPFAFAFDLGFLGYLSVVGIVVLIETIL